MKTLIKIIALGGALMLVGCSKHTVSTTTSTRVTDSTYVKEIPRNVTVTLPADSAEIDIPWAQVEKITPSGNISTDKSETPQNTNSITVKKKSTRIDLQVKVDALGIHVTSKEDSLRQVIHVMDKELFRYRHEVRDTKQNCDCRIPKVYKWSLWFTIFVILAGLVWVYLKFKP